MRHVRRNAGSVSRMLARSSARHAQPAHVPNHMSPFVLFMVSAMRVLNPRDEGWLDDRASRSAPHLPTLCPACTRTLGAPWPRTSVVPTLPAHGVQRSLHVLGTGWCSWVSHATTHALPCLQVSSACVRASLLKPHDPPYTARAARSVPGPGNTASSTQYSIPLGSGSTFATPSPLCFSNSWNVWGLSVQRLRRCLASKSSVLHSIPCSRCRLRLGCFGSVGGWSWYGV